MEEIGNKCSVYLSYIPVGFMTKAWQFLPLETNKKNQTSKGGYPLPLITQITED